MSMNVILVKNCLITLPNGKQKELVETKSLIQTKTNNSYEIVNCQGIENQLAKYEEVIKDCFRDFEHKIFNSYDDELAYILDNKSVPFSIEVETAESQLNEHISEIKEYIDSAIEDGFEIKFQII